MTDNEQRISALFEGMDGEYQSMIRACHKVELDPRLSESAKAEDRAAARKAISEMKARFAEAAIAEVDRLKASYLPQRPEPKKLLTADDRILAQLERLNKMTLLQAELPTASPERLRELWEANRYDDDLNALMAAELSKPDRSSDTSCRVLIEGIKRRDEVPPHPELDKLAAVVRSMTSGDGDLYIAGIAENGLLSPAKMRFISKDLANVQANFSVEA